MIQRLQVKRNEDGFTLIELLIVIIVLGILAAIVVFAVGSTRSDSVKSACKTNEKAIQLGVEAVNTNIGHYPVGASIDTQAGASGAAMLAPSPGAVLKTWPLSKDYTIEYQGPATPAAAQVATTNVYTTKIYKTDGTVATPDLSGGALATGCDGL